LRVNGNARIIVAMEELTHDELIAKLRATTAGNVAAWAEKHGISPSYVGDVLSGRRPPGGKVLAALNVDRVVKYREKGK
jgi:hypothetical protein